MTEETKNKLRQGRIKRKLELGYLNSPETRLKMSIAKRGKNHWIYGTHLSKEHKKNISKGSKGRIVSLETRQKISETLKGKPLSEETKHKMSISRTGNKNHFWGKHHTEETRKKISESHKGKSLSDTHKKKIGDSLRGEKSINWGKHLSEETRRKLSLSHIGKTREKASNWQGGLSFEPYSEEFNDQLKERIRQRDNYRCQQCFRHQDELFFSNGKKYKLMIHHTDYNKKNNDPLNLISLCVNCHSQTNFKREDWTKYFKEKQQ
jgi:hypothetical protein